MKRREFLKHAAITGGTVSLASQLPFSPLFGAEETINLNGRKPFVLYIHLGSSCGLASGLVQPLNPGEWAKGFFTQGSSEGAANPLLNEHFREKSLVFHHYNKCLREISDQLCLVNGSPQTLDHNVARPMQLTGSGVRGASPEWAMGVTQNCRTTRNPNPLIISGGTKTFSVADLALINSGSIDQFRQITSDIPEIPKKQFDGMWDVLKKRFDKKAMGSLHFDPSVPATMDYQIQTLTRGLAELNQAQGDIDSLRTALNDEKYRALIRDNPDSPNMEAPNAALRDRLILAGILAKTGLGHGMTIAATDGHDLHNGGADIETARFTGMVWAQITLFWKWVQSQKLDNDVLVIVAHEFGRSPYNDNRPNATEIIDTSGARKAIVSPGRDHGLFMGMMFLNKNLPAGGRVGNVVDNLTPRAGSDTAGSIVADGEPYTSDQIVGSVLMRVYPGLFPSERIVRKHWPAFKPIQPLLT